MLGMRLFLELFLGEGDSNADWSLPESCSRWEGRDRGFGRAEDAIVTYLKARDNNMSVEEIAKDQFAVSKTKYLMSNSQ